MARIHKRKLTSGRIVWELSHGTGRDRQRFVAGKTKEEAQETLKQFERQLAQHGEAPTDDSIVSAMGQYDAYLKTNRRPTTRIRYMRVLKTFNDLFLVLRFPDVRRLRQLRTLHVEEFKRLRHEGRIEHVRTDEEIRREQALRLEARGPGLGRTSKDRGQFGWLGHRGVSSKVSLRTINYELQALFTFFQWAAKRNLIVLNPAIGVEHFRIPKRALPKFLTSEELTRFFSACAEDDRRMFMCVLLTGMRKGEVEHLCWSDVNFDLGVVFIQEKPDLDWKPKSDERIIPISPLLRDLLAQQHHTRHSDRFVFANRQGNVDTHILERMKATCRRAGIRASTVHALRHSFGAHLRMAGVSLADIGDLLGHRDLATTQIYAKVQQEHLRKAISKLSPLVEPDEGIEGAPRLIVAPGETDKTTN